MNAKDPETIQVGMPLQVTFLRCGEGEDARTCLAFEPSGAQAMCSGENFGPGRESINPIRTGSNQRHAQRRNVCGAGTAIGPRSTPGFPRCHLQP